MDCTSLTSNKTKVEKPSEFEAPVNPSGYFVWAIERARERRGNEDGVEDNLASFHEA